MIVHRSLRLLTGAGLVALSTMGTSPRAYALDADPGSFADIAGRVRNSVVTVAAAVIDRRSLVARGKKHEESEESGGDMQLPDLSPSHPKRKPGEPPRQFTSIGSGFIIDANGTIVTNNHVIEGGNAIYVILSDGTEMKVDKIIGRDPKTDISVLKVTPRPSKPLPAVSFGDSSRTRVGDWVLAIGNPFGLKGTVTAGILSGRGRDISAGPYDDFLQTDAAINRGNSGGPLFNVSGEVIGINTAIFSPSGGSIGLGFAIPSNTARRVVDQLERYGETRWGWIGVRLQTPSDDLAAGMHLAGSEGALIARIDKGSPADRAGLAEGDLILSFAGASIKHARQLPRFIAQSPVGEEVEAVIFRAGERKTIKIKVGNLDDSKAPEPAGPPQMRSKRSKLGKIAFGPLTDTLRERYAGAIEAEGVAVQSAPLDFVGGSPIEPGDIVIEAAHKKVRSIEELDERLAELRQLQRSEALLTLAKPDGSVRFAELPLGEE